MVPVVLATLACGGWVQDGAFEALPVAAEGIEASDPVQALERVGSIPASPSELVVIKGKPQGARVVQYSDWQCPHCFQALKVIAPAVEAAGATLVYRNFPLAGPCNPAIERTDEDRCALALASICAHRIDHFWDLVESAPALLEATQSYAKNPTYAKCIEDPATAEALRQQAETGIALEIKGTPQLYIEIDGVWHTGTVEQVAAALSTP